MKPKLTFLLALTFLFLLGSSSVVFGDEIQDGFDAYKKKDYKEAVKWYRLSAEQGYAGAKLNLGVMYGKGQGVPQDNKEAVRLYRLSAEQGDAKAQSNLGNNYALGEGVPQDYVSAHMWMNLSGSQGITNAVTNRNILEEEMSKQQIEKAQEMARNWKPTSK